MTNFFERIMQIAEYEGYKNANDFAKNGLNWASSEKINRLKSKNNKPSVEMLVEITNKFDKINPEWLLTGKGSMLKSGDTTEVSAQVGNNCIYGSFSGRDIKNNTADDVAKETIEFLKGIIEEKDQQIKEKDEQIKTLLDLMKNKQ